MKNTIKYGLTPVTVLALMGCFGTDSDPKTDIGEPVSTCQEAAPQSTEAQMAQVYAFNNQFGEGSSVSYSGQTTRQVLLMELVTKIKGLSQPGASALDAADLLAYFDEAATTLDAVIMNVPGDLPLADDVVKISDINGSKNLKGKTSDAELIDDNADFKGKTAAELVEAWIAVLAENSKTDKIGSAEVFLDEKGRDLSQLIEKLLTGAISYDQAANGYLAEIGNNTDEVMKDEVGQGFTEAEHHWDEAWGYFGGARDYPSYSDNALADKDGETSYKDSDEDGFLDLQSEVNFGIAKNAGKRDRINCAVNLSQDAFDAFYAGRKALAEGKSATSDEVLDAATDALEAWEKVIAATALHYVNEVIADQNALDENDKSEYSLLDHAKHWSELKGFSLALQYNDNRIISTSQLKTLQSYIGNEPAQVSYDSEAGIEVLAKLDSARVLLGEVYGFEEFLVQNW